MNLWSHSNSKKEMQHSLGNLSQAWIRLICLGLVRNHGGPPGTRGYWTDTPRSCSLCKMWTGFPWLSQQEKPRYRYSSEPRLEDLPTWNAYEPCQGIGKKPYECCVKFYAYVCASLKELSQIYVPNVLQDLMKDSGADTWLMFSNTECLRRTSSSGTYCSDSNTAPHLEI